MNRRHSSVMIICFLPNALVTLLFLLHRIRYHLIVIESEDKLLMMENKCYSAPAVSIVGAVSETKQAFICIEINFESDF